MIDSTGRVTASPISLSAWRDKGDFRKFGANSIFTVEEGEGEVLVLIHGFPTASWDWTWIWSELVGGYRVMTADMLGFGFSDKPPGHDYSLMEQADMFQDWITSEGIPRVHLLCHDYGDTVGQELLARAREGKLSFSIESACFLNGGMIPGMHKPRLIQRLLAGPAGGLISRLMSQWRFNRSFSAVFAPGTQPTRSELDDFWSLLIHNDGKKVIHLISRYQQERVRHRDRWVSALEKTDVPMGFIFGPEDPVSGAHMVSALRDLLPGQDIVELPGIGHYPQVESPEEVVRIWKELMDVGFA